MLIVGLTGGIGSGKTTVANLFAEFNIPIIDADIIAREITQPGYPAYQQIIAHFGDSILPADKQQINRSALRHLIFTDSQQRQWLEKLLHPLIFTEIKNRLTSLQAPYCIVVIPLLIEVSPVDFIDRILVVDLPEAEQIARVAQRDHLSQEQVRAILAAQSKRESRLAKAHDVINNAQDQAALKTKIAELHRRYLAGG